MNKKSIFTMMSLCVTLSALLVIGVLSCTKSPSEKITGTWEMFSDYGIIEKTFNGDTVVTKHYDSWYVYDEQTEKYNFIDDILFIESDTYNYYLADNKLFLTWGNRTEIYTRKTAGRPLSETKKLLIGHWEGYNIEMIFMDDNTVHINKYDNNMDVIDDGLYAYELNEITIIIKKIDNENNNSKFMYDYLSRYGRYVYKINNKALILKVMHIEDGLLTQYDLRRKQ
jgi:hypothetical protein